MRKHKRPHENSPWRNVEAQYRPDWAPPDGLKVLIAGMPRSGTTWLTNVLKVYGIDARHEDIFKLAQVVKPEYPPEVEISGLSAPWARQCADNEVKVLHLIRNPVDCCASCLNYFTGAGWETSWGECCATYLAWHKAISEVTPFFFCMEDLIEGRTLVELVAMCGGDYTKLNPAETARETSTGGSSTPKPRREWGDLPDAVQKLARDYGYGRTFRTRRYVTEEGYRHAEGGG